MKACRHFRTYIICLLLALHFGSALADEYSDTISLFKNAGESGTFFSKNYRYAVFPTIGKGGIGIGGAHGKGRVYVAGKYVGDTSMTQLTIGFQLGGEAFSEIIFFEDRRAFEEFTGGNFEFSAVASAVVITASAKGAATTTGSSTGASGGKKDATTVGSYHKGMATYHPMSRYSLIYLAINS